MGLADKIRKDVNKETESFFKKRREEVRTTIAVLDTASIVTFLAIAINYIQ